MKSQHKPKDVDWSPYYEIAEGDVDWQWAILKRFLFSSDGPLFDFSVVLDFACGRGRIAERFAEFAGKLILCDIKPESMEFCRQRFAKRESGIFEFLVNTESGIPLPDDSVTFVYSWDAMVHFEMDALKTYFREFSRILKTGGCGLIHHSNLGAIKKGQGEPWHQNPGWRAHVSADEVKMVCERSGMAVLKQEVLDWSMPKLDAITIFRKKERGSLISRFLRNPKGGFGG